MVNNRSRHRCCDFTAATAIFQQYGKGDLGRLDRCKGDESRVFALPLIKQFFLIKLALLDLHHLRGP